MASRLPAGNLRHELSSFVGRREELLDIRHLLSTTRMVTLTGVGGVGKSRLALRAADQIRRSFPDGVWQVELSGLQDPVQLTQALTGTLGVGDQSAGEPLEVLSTFLSRRRLLLVVNDCEHLVPACASLFAALLRAAPELRVLVTSREMIRVPGEYVYPVAPLAVPDPADPVPPPAQLADPAGQYPGVALFAERARAVRPGFALTPDNVDMVVRVCQRLEGLPLAIELASARLRSLGVEELARRLDDRFALLTTHSSAVVLRHRTLRSAIEWSFTLCSKSERLLWTRASVFAGRFDLEAAESVCVSDRLPAGQVLEAMTGLIDKSVLTAEEHEGHLRYRMLDTVRQYGDDVLKARPGDGLDAAGEVGDTRLRRRHRDFYLDLAERFDADWFGPRQVLWSQRMHAELPNLRVALGFCAAEANGSLSTMRLAGALQYFWWGCGEPRDGLRWLERALAVEPTPTAEWVRAMTTYGRLLTVQARGAVAVGPGRTCVDLARRVGDPFLLIEALVVLSLNLLTDGAPAEALPLLDEALELAGGLPDRPQAMASASLYRSVGAVFAGDTELARRLLADCQRVCRAHGDLLYLGYTLSSSALAALMTGQMAEAGAFAREAVPIHHSLHDTLGLRVALEYLAWIADAAGDHRRAARLLGAADAQARLLDGAPLRIEQFISARRNCEASVRAALGEAVFQTQFHLGEELGAEDLVAFALTADHAADPSPPVPSVRHGSELPKLSRREMQTAVLVAQGLSNRDIAGRLVIAQRTAESHVANVMLKLGFTSRAQIAVWYARRADA